MTITAGDWQVQALEPLTEINALHEEEGSSVDLGSVVDLQEMGVPEGLIGTVDSISACPAIEAGAGRVVLATVNHLNDFVYHLTLTDAQGNADALGITGYHKVYTEDRGWVIASELVQGEEVRTATGDLYVSESVRDPGTFTVYNMAVETDHVYYVGELTALVHNNCPDIPKDPINPPEEYGLEPLEPRPYPEGTIDGALEKDPELNEPPSFEPPGEPPGPPETPDDGRFQFPDRGYNFADGEGWWEWN